MLKEWRDDYLIESLLMFAMEISIEEDVDRFILG